MNKQYKSVIEDCLNYFKSIDVDAYQADFSYVYVHVGFDIYVQISDAEIQFRADEWKNQQPVITNEARNN